MRLINGAILFHWRVTFQPIDRRFIAVRLLWVMNSRRPDLCLTAQDFRFAITGGFVVLRSTP